MKKILKKDKEKIRQELAVAKQQTKDSLGKIDYTISLNRIKSLADNFRLSPREIEILALRDGIVPERYQRNLGVFSPEEQIKLRQSKVAIIGSGGLGGTVLELLARVGIGELVIIDKDIIAESNLNRQILARETNLGKQKVKVAQKRIKEINSSIQVKIYATFINADNVKELIKGIDVVVDALDNLPSRFVLQEACRELKIPLVHGAIAGFNGQLMTIFPEDKGLELIYGNKNDLPEKGSETKLGSPTVTPAIIAALEAQEVIKILLKRGNLFRHRLLYLDLENGTMETLELVESD
ncbi:MAG: hypothetical protein Kow00103_14840 [Candidatus Caldatribacteriota bacterium]